MRDPFSHAPSIVASHRRGEAVGPRQHAHAKAGPDSAAAPPDARTFFDSREVAPSPQASACREGRPPRGACTGRTRN